MSVHVVLVGSLVANVILFMVAWAGCVKLKNFSPVDAFWALGIGCTSLFLLFASPPVSGKEIVGAFLIGAWSFRLVLHLAKRIARHHPKEDSRYIKLREVWQGRVNSSFFWFFQAQALSVVFLAFPFHLIAVDPDPLWHPLHWFGALVTLIGLVGETVADRQMSSFKASHPDPKSVCRKGLWNYSRHPNYFFESVIWTGIFLFASGSPYGWTTLYAPAIITFLLLKVTGIPPTEASAIARKGEAYREYQRTTSAFIPKFKNRIL